MDDYTNTARVGGERNAQLQLMVASMHSSEQWNLNNEHHCLAWYCHVVGG